MFRILVDIKNIDVDQKVIITGEDHHYLTKVLRLKEGDKIIIFNEAEEFLSSVFHQSSKELTLHIEAKLENNKEPNKNVILAFGYPKGEKIEWIVQKATELGVTELWPVTTSRSIIKLEEKKLDKKIERLWKIAKEAAEQCGRLRIPKIKVFKSTKEMAKEVTREDLLIIPWEEEKDRNITDTDLNNVNGRVILFVGPEGGLDKKDLEPFDSYNTITLGKRILRAETACIAATTIVMYNLGELK